MASEDVSLGDWQSRIPDLNLPRLKWKSHRAWGLLSAAIVFVIASLAVPVRYASVQTGRALDVRREVEELGEKIETLKEAELLEGAQGQTFQQQLDQLAQNASGEDPAKTWEALDHLADVVEAAAKEGAESARAEQEKLAQAEALAEGLMAGADKMDPKLMTEAMQTLSEMMKNALEEDQALAASLSPQLQEAIKSGQSGKSGALKPEQLKDLSAALSQNRSALNQKLSKLDRSGQSKMIDPNSLKGGARSGRDNSGLSRFLQENAKRMSVKDAIEAWAAGKGGVGRGRGDAAMSWTDGTSEKGARFKEKELPPSVVAGLKDSQLVGLSASAPTAGNSTAAHGALNQAAQGGGSAYTQTILPRHKGAVKRYFERPQNH